MFNSFKVSKLTGCLLTATTLISSIQPMWAQDTPPTITPPQPPSNYLEDLVEKWGYTVVPCDNQNSSKIYYQNNVVCVRSTQKLPTGDYTYNSSSNTITPINSDTNTSNTNIPRNSDTNTSNREASKSQVEFTFVSSYEYGTCLDDILRFHEGALKQQDGQIVVSYQGSSFVRPHPNPSKCIKDIIAIYGNQGISRQQAYELVALADFRATRLLDQTLYPTQGIRIRVARLLCFVYSIDKTDSADPQVSAEIAQCPPSR